MATTYTDRAGYAVPMPGARVRPMLFGKNFQPGTPINTALRLLYQFKIWPADMVTRAWEREIYGTIGDGKYDRMAGLVEVAVAAIIFGTPSEAVRDAIQGKDPIAKLREHPIASMVEGAQRSGFGSLVGDGAVRSPWFFGRGLACRTHLRADRYADGHPAWRGRQRDRRALRCRGRAQGPASLALARDRTDEVHPRQYPVHEPVADQLGHQRADLAPQWINPGYLQRAEQRERQKSGIQYLVSPVRVDRYITGR